MARVTHFEVHAEDPERAVRFYAETLDWQFVKWEGPMDYWMIRTGPAEEPGIDGGMLRRHGLIDGQAVIAYVCTVNVTNLDGMVKKVLASGGALAMPKMAVPGIGWLAYAKDTEGNLFGMMQADPAAA
jgi:predicted enzyme related to lactoylglutathione lyase